MVRYENDFEVEKRIQELKTEIVGYLESQNADILIPVLDHYLETPGVKPPYEVRCFLSSIRFPNKVKDIQEYFSTPEKPVDRKDFYKFWWSLSVLERIRYRLIDLD